MKNIRAYLTTAVVSLMLVVVSAFSMSAVKAALAAMDSDIRRKPAAVPCCVCFQLKLA